MLTPQVNLIRNDDYILKSKQANNIKTRNNCIYHNPVITDNRKNYTKNISNLSGKTNSPTDYSPLRKYSPCIRFMGYPVYILDGDIHANNIEHFAHAVSKDMETSIINVDVVTNEPSVKKLKSLEEQLIILNKKNSFKDEYITIPAFVSVPLLNIQDQYNSIMGENKKFTPDNIKSNKENLLLFLKKIYENPDSYRSYIEYMDPIHQGIEYTYGVIRETNKLIKKGAKIYIPSGHPHDYTLKWLANERGYKPELYHYIASGYDKGGVIHKMQEEIKGKNWYNFNLLALSEANIIGIKDAKGIKDYLFASYDSCITDSARGVYNFSPVRENGKLVGYSFTDTTTNEYPYEDFPENAKVANIVNFVGKKLYEVSADEQETSELKQKISGGFSINSCADKLYKIEDVFNYAEIEQKKLLLEGKYTDKTRTLFFNVNSSGEVVFPRCNCEGSQKPSVMSVWGCCYSTINAIARDIKTIEKTKKQLDEDNNFKQVYKYKINTLLECGKNAKTYKEASDYFLDAIEKNKILVNKFGDIEEDFRLHYNLGLLHEKFGQLDYAEACFNNSLNILCKKLILKGKTVMEIKEELDKYNKLKMKDDLYDKNFEEYSKKSFLSKIFSQIPQKPKTYGKYKEQEENYKRITQLFSMLNNLYLKLGTICEKKGNLCASEVCKYAVEDLVKMNNKADEIIKRRADKNIYIGDLYPEMENKAI